MPNDYRASTAEMKDGRSITGIVKQQDDKTVTLITQNETLTLPRNEIQSLQQSELSMMPEGLLAPLTDQEARDLLYYLSRPARCQCQVKRNNPSALALLVFTSIVASTAAIDPNDKLLIPLRVHLLAAKGLPEITTTLTDMDVTRILHKINLVWAPAGLHFYLESVVKEEAANPEVFLAHKGAAERFGLLSLRPKNRRFPRCFTFTTSNECRSTASILAKRFL